MDRSASELECVVLPVLQLPDQGWCVIEGKVSPPF